MPHSLPHWLSVANISIQAIDLFSMPAHLATQAICDQHNNECKCHRNTKCRVIYPPPG